MDAKNDETPTAPTIEVSNMPVTYEKLTMNSLAKSNVNCTNSIVISDIKIHMDEDGRYSLNDLHAASGKSEKDKPANWLRAEKTIELIDEILNAQIRAFKNGDNSNSAELEIKKPVDSKKGRYGGTYVCKELVYSYAMWISAAFALKVIRAYDALVTGKANEALRIAKTSVNQRTPLRDAVNMLVGKKGLRYDDAYTMVHQRFGIDSIDELSLEQIPMAVEYVHRMALDGEYIGKEALPIPAEKQFTDEEICSLAWLWLVADKMRQHAEKTYPALRALESRYAGEAYDISKEFNYWLRKVMDVLVRESSHISPDNTKAPCMDALLHVRNHRWNSTLLPRH